MIRSDQATKGLRRASRGGWLGGVCAGLAPVSPVSVRALRAAFVAATLAGGVGVAVYLAAWLIIPAAGSGDGDGVAAPTREASGAVGLAQACAGFATLAALAAAGALATVFGFGWAVAAAGAACLVAVLIAWQRLGPAWALLPVAALTLPAVAVAAGGLRLAPRAGQSIVRPASARDVSGPVYRSGLDTLLIDLRRTALPATGTVPLRIDAGMRRTIVALPAGECVRVAVDYHVNPFAARLTALVTGRSSPLFSSLDMFGRLYGTGDVRPAAPASLPGPLLQISFHSQGGSLYVRDYPDQVDPEVQPDWPGYQVHVERRPDTRGVPRKAARALIRHWLTRRAAERASASEVKALTPGPCDPPRTAGRRG